MTWPAPKLLNAEENPGVKPVSDLRGLPTRIAFGSCAHQDKPQPILHTAAHRKPDLFIYLGDNSAETVTASRRNTSDD